MQFSPKNWDRLYLCIEMILNSVPFMIFSKFSYKLQKIRLEISAKSIFATAVEIFRN